jgi:hypothetical protein
MIGRLRNHRGFVIILCLYLTVALLYGVTIPIFETPDANGHYAYIHELTEGRGLPVQGTPSGARVTGYVASHPPLYYTLCAALTSWVSDDVDLQEWAWRNPYQTMGDASRTVNKNRLIHTAAERFPWQGTPLTMHIARLVSTVLGALVVLATYGTALELFPDRRWLALGATALAAFNPMFVFTGARVSNDAAVAAFGSLTTWGAVRLAVKGLSRKGLILTGVALGLAILSKLSGAVFAPIVPLALLIDASRRTQRGMRDLLRRGRLLSLAADVFIVFGPAALISGWWFARNLVLYDELMGVDAWLSHTATVRANPIGLLSVIPELRGLEKSYWAMFGWFNIAVAPWMYRFWWVLVRVALIGLGLVLMDQWTSRRFTRSVGQGVLILVSALLLNLGSVWRFIMIVLGAQGRYLMPATTSISILIMLGLSRLCLVRWRPVLAAFVGAAHLGLAVISLFVFILPAYAKPEVIQESDLPGGMTRLDLTFDGTPIQLLGGDIEPREAHSGDLLPVNLYWRATQVPQQDLSVFVQVLGRDLEPIGGVDSYPGRGNFPPSLWRPGVIYQDLYLLPLASDVEVPTIAALHAGLWTQEGHRLTARRSSDQRPLDLALLDLVPVRPRQPLSDDATYPLGVRFDAKSDSLAEERAIELVGYDLSAEEVAPGDTLTVTLVWRAQASLDTDYTVFVHLLDARDELVTQSDHPPLDGAYPTSFWISGDVVRDPHVLEIDGSVLPGRCTLVVGMYRSGTVIRLPAYDSSGARVEDDAILIGRLTIR